MPTFQQEREASWEVYQRHCNTPRSQQDFFEGYNAAHAIYKSSHAFTCPECEGHWFGTSFKDKNMKLDESTVHCHDQFNVGCKFSGTRKECITKIT